MPIQDAYQKAISFAATVHGEQKVPGKPYTYVVHLSEVAMEIFIALGIEKSRQSNNEYNEEMAIQCALLHDTIEDTQATYEDVLVLFGIQVAMGVRALTKNKLLEKSQQMMDSITRIQQQPKEIWMVKMADRITNLQKPPAYWTSEKKMSYWKESNIIYQELKEGNAYLGEQLSKRIQEYKQYL